VDADDFIFVGPAGHEALEVRRLEGFVEADFNVVSAAAKVGCGLFDF
jgi:hypothetical protein